jgi:S-formylglutathione hydrolase FrmB
VELPEYLHKVFNISNEKSDTLIAGLSMGGYGAMRAGLLFPERYFAVGSFSGVLALEPLFMHSDAETAAEFPFLAAVSGNLATTPLNPINLLSNAHDQKIYVSCGLQDELIVASQLFEKRAKELKVPVRFSYSAGAHDWIFWNHEIGEFLRFALEGK